MIQLVINAKPNFLKELKDTVWSQLPDKERQRFEAIGVRDSFNRIKPSKELPNSIGLASKFLIYDYKNNESVSCYVTEGEDIADASSNRDKITKQGKIAFRKTEGLGFEVIGGQARNQELRQILLIHPQNEDNKDKKFHLPPPGNRYAFKEFNREKVASDDLEKDMAITEAKYLVMKMKDEDVLSLSKALWPSKYASMSPKTQRMELMTLAGKTPERINEIQPGSKGHTTGMVAEAQTKGVISFDKFRVLWADATEIKSFSPKNGQVFEQFVNFLVETDDVRDRLASELRAYKD